MPVVLDDEMLIPPSMRRKHYDDSGRVYEISDMSSVIDLPPHTRIVERTHQEPVVLHQNTYVAGPPVSEIDIVREREYIIDLSGARGRRNYHRTRAPHAHEFSAEYSNIDRERRARSVGYDSYDDYCCSSCDDSDTYYDDGGPSFGGRRRDERHEGSMALESTYRRGRRVRYGSPRRHGNASSVRDSYRHTGSQGTSQHKIGRELASVAGATAVAGLAGAAVHKLRRRSSSTTSITSNDSNHHNHHHPARDAAVVGLAAAGAKKLYDRRHQHKEYEHGSHQRYSDEHSDPHHRARRLSEIGLGSVAAGTVQKLYSHHRNRDRSQSSHRSHGNENHTGRHVAAAALGATAAGLAAHKHAQHHSQNDSYATSDEDHRGRKIAAGLATATAAGIAAKHYHDRHQNRSRSSSTSSTSSSKSSHPVRRAAAVIGPTELARHRQRHKSRSHSRHGILRRRSSSSSSSHHGKSHKLRNTAIGLGALGAAEIAHHRKKSRSRSRPGILRRRSSYSSSSDSERGHSIGRRPHGSHYDGFSSRSPSPSRPGLHRRRSKSVSLPHHRSSSRGTSIARSATAAMSGALVGDRHRRAHSADGEKKSSRTAGRRHQIDHDNGNAGMVGRLVGEAVRGVVGGKKTGFRTVGDVKHGLANGIAYKIGETVAESIQRTRR